MTISAGRFEILSQGNKANFDFKVFGDLVDKGREVYEKAMDRRENFEKEMNEFVLNAAAPTLAALGHEASKRRVERAEKHGVVGLAEKLANNYRVENFAFGSSMSELAQNVVMKPGKKVGISNVSLRDSFSRHAGLVKKDMLAMHPKVLQKQLEKGNVDLRKGSLVLLAHEIAKMSEVHKRMVESGGDLYREYGRVEKRIRHLVGIGQALINGEFSDKAMMGGVAALETATKDKTNKRARALTIFGMTVASSVLAACGGSAEAAPPATQVSGNGGQPTVEKTPVVQVSPTIESTPISIIIPAPTTTAVVEITVGEPIPSIDFVAVPAYVPEASTPIDDPNISNQVMELREHGLSVLHSAGYVAYRDGDGKEYFPSLDVITSADGEATLKKGEMNEQGVVTYKSEDGKVVENHLLSFDCPDNELCYEALSFNEEDQGILYLIRVDKVTGKVVAYVNTGVAGEAVAAGKEIPWQNGESEYWQSSVTGEAALQRGNVKALSHENGVLTFLDSKGGEHSVDDQDVAFYPGFGTIVTDNDGWYMWNDMSDEWVLMSQADSYGGTQFANGEVLYDVDGKYVIADENNYYWVDGIEEGDKLTVITEDGKRWAWDSGLGWVESVVKFSLERIEGMTSNELLSVAPSIEGYSPIRVAERYVLYEGAGGVRNLAYDMFIGEEVEIPEYQVCAPEKFYNCEIPKEDLISGKYWLWLNSLDVPFEVDKIKDTPLVSVNTSYGWVNVVEIYHDSGEDQPADFNDPSTAPFNRGFTAGTVLYENEKSISFGIVRPIAFYNKMTQKIDWVVTLESYYDYHDGKKYIPNSPQFAKNIETWTNNYNVTPIMSNNYSISTGLPDPVLTNTYETYTDMDNRLANFAAGDTSALSAPGIVVQTGSNAIPTSNRYK